jgi:hypothetical protein
MQTASELRRLGYQRPGLVIDPAIEENIDHRFSAGFYAGQSAEDLQNRVPLFNFHSDQRPAFQKWIEKFQPDVVVCTHPEIREWLECLGLHSPRDIGLVHLDLTPELEGWSGMNQNNDSVGAFAVDLVIGQLHRNESGIPEHPKCMMIESHWVEGSTLRTLPVTKKGKRSATPTRSTGN